MLGLLWLTMLTAGALYATIAQGPDSVARIAAESSKDAVQLCLGLAGLIGLWSGISALARESGLMNRLADFLEPVTRRLFPSLPRNSSAHGAIAAAVSANLLGLGGAATPLGLQGMEELARARRVSADPSQASDAMCTFVALIASGLTVVPTTIISVRAQAGSAAPSSVAGTILVATLCSTVTAISLDAVFRRVRRNT